jgi:hypothetical protein
MNLIGQVRKKNDCVQEFVKHKLEKGVQRCCGEIEIAANIEAKEANAIELASLFMFPSLA